MQRLYLKHIKVYKFDGVYIFFMLNNLFYFIIHFILFILFYQIADI